MGREANISPEQVHAVADAIKAEGGKPTLRAVRERLGTGSMGTIARHLQQWKAGQERHSVADLVLPPALQRAILDFMSAELSAARAPLEAELVDLQQAGSDLAAENERQGRAIEEQAAAMEGLAGERSAAEGRARQLTDDLVAAKEEASRERDAAERARTELAKAMLRLEAMPRLEEDLSTARSELAEERQGRIAAEQSAAVLAAQKADLESRIGEARSETVRTAEQVVKLQARNEELAEALADARVSNEGNQARADDLASKVKLLQQERDEARDEAKRAREQVANSRAKASVTAKKKATSN